MKRWYQSKAIWVGLAALATAAGGYFSGELSLENAVQAALTAAMGIFIRTGVGRPIGSD